MASELRAIPAGGASFTTMMWGISAGIRAMTSAPHGATRSAGMTTATDVEVIHASSG